MVLLAMLADRLRQPLVAALVATWLGAFAARPALAQTGAERALAEKLFQEGRALLDDGKVAEACRKLEESYRLAEKLGTLLNVATCHEKEGKTASAWAEFTDAATIAKQKGQADREDYAKGRLAVLTKRLSHLVVELNDAPEGTELRIDNNLVGRAAWGTPLPVDPGEHHVEVTAPGREAWSKSVLVAPKASTTRVQVPTLAGKSGETGASAKEQRRAADEAKAPEGRPVTTDASTADDAPSSVDAQLVAGGVVLGAGLVVVGVGSYFGIRTIMKQDDSDPHCADTLCDQEGVDLRADAKKSALISNVALGVGLGAAVGGLVLMLTSGSSAQDSGTSWRAAPWLSPTAQGGAMEMTW